MTSSDKSPWRSLNLFQDESNTNLLSNLWKDLIFRDDIQTLKALISKEVFPPSRPFRGIKVGRFTV